MKEINIALISPSKNAYSETFIQQHKKYLKGNVWFYYGGYLPNSCEKGYPITRNKWKKKYFKFLNKTGLTELTIHEQSLKASFLGNNIQVVVAEYGLTGAAVLNVCKNLKIPLIPIFHGFDASIKEILEKQQSNYKKLLNYSDSVLAVSNAIKETLIALGGKESKIYVSPCGPNPSFFEVKPSRKTSNFIGIGRFVDKKAPYYTILAFAEVLKKFPESNLTIVGEGGLYNTCVNLVKYLGLEESVFLPGKMSPEKIKDLFTGAFAFVQHSVVALNGDSEGTPVAVLEASAASLPVVSTLHGGISDVIINNKTGFLVEEHDVLNMAKKMIYLLENRKEAEEMGSFSRDFIKQNYTLEKHIGMINHLINKAIIKHE
ncbi:hypothetical protein AXE80_08490 [Wenyingzhuangia fucanilytica]|uniref:Glycosyl transferase family 1 domain-containing protein n=1 Tax=Wenyingzhuangia fucanilytica TaxID=1790137 RepID=A0A1B1Y6C0_9FLAO|nr:glycosyltransferase [Wenyingzhuangia fucanilytica]ANW96313.1 hypothetical protein AXE80_08490 [Wenyingzhuangia fucanilytica]